MVTYRSAWVLILLSAALMTACSTNSSPSAESAPTTSEKSDFGEVPTVRLDGTLIRLDERSPMPSSSECSTDGQGNANGFKWATEDGRNLIETRFTLAEAGGSTLDYLHIVAGAETLYDQTYRPGGDVLGSVTQQGQSNDFRLGSIGPSSIDDRRPQFSVAFRCQDANIAG